VHSLEKFKLEEREIINVYSKLNICINIRRSVNYEQINRMFGNRLTCGHLQFFLSFAYNSRAPKKNLIPLVANHLNDVTSSLFTVWFFFSIFNINILSSEMNENNGNRNFYSVQNRYYFRVLLPLFSLSLFFACCLFIVFVVHYSVLYVFFYSQPWKISGILLSNCTFSDVFYYYASSCLNPLSHFQFIIHLSHKALFLLYKFIILKGDLLGYAN
jgi:hypothetical protein